MSKSFYTYDEIKLLKQKLESSAYMSEEILKFKEARKFKESVLEYDKILSGIGVNGNVYDPELVEELNETKILADNIKNKLRKN